MSTLFEITNEFRALYEMATEDDEAFADTLESLEYDLVEKSGGYVAVIQQLEMEQAKAEELSKMFRDKAAVRKNNIKRMKDALMKAMDATNKTEIDTGTFVLKIKKNGGLQPLVIDDPTAVPDGMTKITIEPDKDKIRKFVKENKCDWAHLEERGRHLEIK